MQSIRRTCSSAAILGFIAFGLLGPVDGQPIPQSLAIQSPAAPSPTGVGTAIHGSQTGATPLYYWVIARYPSGTAVTGPVVAANTVGAANLTAANYVTVGWNGQAVATGYDVLRNTSPNYPAPCASCAVVLNTGATMATDNGAALAAYPAAGLSSAVPAQAVWSMDNIHESQPFVNVQLLSTKFNSLYRLPLIDGATTAGNCVSWGQYGTLTDAGAACGTGSGSGVSAGFGILTAGSNPTTVSADTSVMQTLAVGQSGSPLYCASASGSATAYTCAMSPTLTAYTAGMTVAWKVDTSCMGGVATTLNVDTLGAKAVKQADGTTDPSSGDCPANRQVTLRYDGTVFRIVGGGTSGSSQFTGFTADAGFWVPYLTTSTTTRTATLAGWTNGGAYCNRIVSPGPLTFNRLLSNVTGGDASKYYGLALYDSSGAFVVATTPVVFSGAGRISTIASTTFANAGVAYYVCLSSNATAGTETMGTFNYSSLLGNLTGQSAYYGSSNLFSFTIAASSVDWATPTAPVWPANLPSRTESNLDAMQLSFFTR